MLSERIHATAEGVPLFVDVDGTLTRADISLESFIHFVRSSWFAWAILLVWLLRGRSVAKAMVARRHPVDPARLPYRPEVLDLINQAQAEGRPVILASASHWRNIVRIARYHGLTTEIIGTRANHNAKGSGKLVAIRAFVGPHGEFDYIGDSRADTCLWREARKGWSAHCLPKGVAVESLHCPRPPFWRVLIKAMRPHQWTKNALVFVPIFASGQLLHPGSLLAAVAAAGLTSIIASAIYVINDMVDIDNDRAHRTKFRRPLAHGDLSIPAALTLSLVLASAGLVGGWMLGGLPLLLSLLTYVVLTTAYSFRIKAAMVADVIMLASLYTVRIWIGAVAVSVTLTFWLLLFSIFLFLSLAYLKRYIEMKDAIVPHRLISGRGYVASDLDIVMMSGVSSGMVAILVLALFANDMSHMSTYKAPQLLWLLCLPLLYWINRIWMMARRGEVDGDPVAFAVRDRRSMVLGMVMVGIFVAAQNLSLR